jgi:hypothetical protein
MTRVWGLPRPDKSGEMRAYKDKREDKEPTPGNIEIEVARTK